MTMRKYIVTVHEDGHITANEYEDPQGFGYSVSESVVVRRAYNQALLDVGKVIDCERVRCYDNNWTGRGYECDLIRTAVQKLFRKS